MKFAVDFEIRAESADGLEVGELKVADTGIVRVLEEYGLAMPAVLCNKSVYVYALHVTLSMRQVMRAAIYRQRACFL